MTITSHPIDPPIASPPIGTSPIENPTGAAAAPVYPAIAADAVTQHVANGQTILDQVTVRIGGGELVAIVGASGAGKSTLLEVLAGTKTPSVGRVAVHGADTAALSASERSRIGFVAQTDVTSEDLTLGRMLDYAAQLRLPAGITKAERREVVANALEQVELAAFAATPMRGLSGGQRRRASIAVELLTDPAVCLLDEPTSGLDPATGELVVRELRGLADSGRTVVFVTHDGADLAGCDRIIALAPGGRVVFDGSPSQAMAASGATDPEQLHRALVAQRVTWMPRLAPTTSTPSPGQAAAVASQPTPAVPTPRPSRMRQWWALTGRTLENVWRNKLTLAIMVGSPAMVIAMFAVLFQPGAFDPAAPSPTSAIMITFWVAFGGFFFGLTYGLLQVVPEAGLMRREHRAGVGSGTQVLAKLAALAPILIAIDVAMLGVLVWLDRLPSADLGTYALIGVTLALDAIASLALGLLASALVRTPSQASLALPMLCFPAVLFSGAILAVPVMAPVGRAISAAVPDRWAFESIGADLGLRRLFADEPSGLGPALLTEYGDTWTITHATTWATLACFAVGLTLATWAALERRCRTDERLTS